MSHYGDPRGRQPDWEPTEQYSSSQQGYDPRDQQSADDPRYRQDPYAPRPGQPQNPFGAESDEKFGIAGTVLALLGAVVLIVSFTGVEFMRLQGVSATFGDVHDRVSSPHSAAGFAEVYFGWLAWTLAIVTVVCAVASSFPSPALRVTRIIGVVAGVAAAGLAFLAIQISDNISYLTYLEHARVGFYLMLVGFVLGAIGAGIGPRKV